MLLDLEHAGLHASSDRVKIHAGRLHYADGKGVRERPQHCIDIAYVPFASGLGHADRDVLAPRPLAKTGEIGGKDEVKYRNVPASCQPFECRGGATIKAGFDQTARSHRELRGVAVER